MAKNKPTSSVIIPTIDLSPFINCGDESGRKKVMEDISNACTNLGVFKIKNHSLDLCDQLMELSKTYFRFTKENKKGFTFVDRYMSGAGYDKRPNFPFDTFHNYEYMLMYSPETSFNGVPIVPLDYRKTFEEAYKYFLKTAQTLEEIINDCLGLPSNFLKKYNDDRSSDYLLAMKYPLPSDTNNIGIVEHEDPNIFTFILEERVGGLEVLKDGQWIPIIPTKGDLVVTIGDVIQVLSNKKFRSVTHRAVRQKGKRRHVIDFCYNLLGEKWVEPLPALTREIGVKPKYKGFMFKDYMAFKIVDNRSPPWDPKMATNLTYYEI